MEEGAGISLYILVGIIIFGLFVGISILFGEGFLASSKDIIACVESYVSDGPTDCGSSGEDEEIPNYVLATDKDFVGASNGEFRYTGDAEYVKLPNVIKGVDVTSYRMMFEGSSVKKVIADNPNVTDMYGMFYNSKATELDISNLDTSNVTGMNNMFAHSQATEIKGLENFNTRNVTNMGGMFYNSQATEIKGLENFDTSNVRDMKGMFRYSKATELDLSNFNTSNVTDMSGMFANSEAKTVYARTQADADKYNVSSYKPDGLQVIVKQ